MAKQKEDISLIERHAQTILTGIVAGLIGWVGMNVSDQGKQIAVLTEQVKFLNSQIAELQVFSRQPRFTKDDFYSLIQPYDQRISENNNKLAKRDGWMESVDKRLNDLEKHN